jgi:hypothetical protein
MTLQTVSLSSLESGRGNPRKTMPVNIPWERGSMRHRATQLILPFEPALPGRQLTLGAEIVADDDADNTTTAGEAGGTATPVNAGRSRRRRFDREASR